MEIKDLDRQIKDHSLGNLYFFYGEEQFLMENKIKSIQKAILSPDFADLNFVCLEEKKLPLSLISNELMSVPVMSDKKMIVIKNSGIFNNVKSSDYKALMELIADIPEYLCVIFTEKEFDKKKEKNLDPFKKFGNIIKFDFLSPIQLERWIDKVFSDNGKSILPRDVSTIVKLCGQSMAVLSNEVAKLLNFAKDRTKITEADVLSVISPSIDARLFDVIDSLSVGKNQGVLKELHALRALGENPSTILSLLSSRMGELLMVKQLVSDGLSADKISTFFEPKKPSFVVSRLIEQSKSFSEEYLSHVTLLGPEYTALVRTGKLDKWAAVEMYAAALLKKAR